MQYFISLRMPVNLTQYQGEIGVFNVSIITIKIKHRPISRRCYFCNTNQVYRNIYFFCIATFCFIILLPSKKPPKISLLCTGLFFCSLYCTVLWMYKLKTSMSGDIETNPGPAQKNPKVLWLSQSITVKRLYYSPQNGYHLFIGNLS